MSNALTRGTGGRQMPLPGRSVGVPRTTPGVIDPSLRQVAADLRTGNRPEPNGPSWLRERVRAQQEADMETRLAAHEFFRV